MTRNCKNFLKGLIAIGTICAVLSIHAITCTTMTGCSASTSFYKTDKAPTLRLRNTGQRAMFAVLYFWVSNPFDWNFKGVVVCYDVATEEKRHSKKITVPAKTDKIIDLVVGEPEKYFCRLIERF